MVSVNLELFTVSGVASLGMRLLLEGDTVWKLIKANFFDEGNRDSTYNLS